jgi:hypothetical protein
MREIEAVRWQEIGAGWSGPASADRGGHWRTRSEASADLAGFAALAASGLDAPGASWDHPVAEPGGTAEGAATGLRQSLALPVPGRRPGLLLIELPEQDTLGLDTLGLE